MLGSGPWQAFPEKAIQPKGRHEKRLPHYRLWLSTGTKQDLSKWETFLQSYNAITMFRDSLMTTTGERGICVTISPDGWRVEKGGSSSVGAGPRPS